MILPSTTSTTNYTTKTFRDPELNLHHAVCFDENSWIGSRLTPCSHQIFLEEWKFGSTNRDSLILYNRIKFSLRGGDNLKLWFVSDQNRRDGDKLGSTHRHLFMFCGRIVIFLECRLGSTENCDSFTHYNNRIKFSWRGAGDDRRYVDSYITGSNFLVGWG
jgi:hypothetical protein